MIVFVSVRMTWPPALIRSSSSSVFGDLLDGGDVAGLAALEGDQLDALAAAMLEPELGQRDALAVAGLGQDEQVRVGLDDAHRDDRVALAGEADADDAAGVRPIARTSVSWNRAILP